MAIPINEDPYHAAHVVWLSKDEVDTSPILFYRPRSIEDIVLKTKFNKREVQLIYRSFKQLCPSGIIQNDTFHDIYSQFFPHSNSTIYSNMIFKTLDRDFNGFINFEDFIIGLSTITRGSIEEKLDWIFSLYDINNRGYIGEMELRVVTESIYALLSRSIHGQATVEEIASHSQDVFRKLTNNGIQKTISRNQFIEICLADEDLCHAFVIFDTKL